MSEDYVVHDVIGHIRTLVLMELEQYTPDDHARISNQVRVQLGDRLEKMLRTLEPLISGDFGEPPMPGHLQAYLAAMKLFGDMYQVTKPPRGDDDMVEASKVAKMIEVARMEAAAEAVEAVQAQRQITSTAEYEVAARKLRAVLGGHVEEVEG